MRCDCALQFARTPRADPQAPSGTDPPPPGPNVTKTITLPDAMKVAKLLFVTVQVIMPPGESVCPEVDGPQSALLMPVGSRSRKGPLPVRELPAPVINTVTGRSNTFAAVAALKETSTETLVGVVAAGPIVSVLGLIVRSGTPMRNVGFTLSGAPPPDGVPVNVTPKSLLGDTGTPADMQKLAGDV
jgi:hypothetical protein